MWVSLVCFVFWKITLTGRWHTQSASTVFGICFPERTKNYRRKNNVLLNTKLYILLLHILTHKLVSCIQPSASLPDWLMLHILIMTSHWNITTKVVLKITCFYLGPHSFKRLFNGFRDALKGVVELGLAGAGVVGIAGVRRAWLGVFLHVSSVMSLPLKLVLQMWNLKYNRAVKAPRTTHTDSLHTLHHKCISRWINQASWRRPPWPLNQVFEVLQRTEARKAGSANADGLRLLAAAVFWSLRLTEPSAHWWHKAAKTDL